MRRDIRLRRRTNGASAARSSVCSWCSSSPLPEWGWRTGGPAPNTSWAATRKGRDLPGLPEGLPGLSLSRVYEVQQLAVSRCHVLSGASQSQHRRTEPGLGRATVSPTRTEAAKNLCSPHATTAPRPRPTSGSTNRVLHQAKKPGANLARHPRRTPLDHGAELLSMRDVALSPVVPRKRRAG